MECYFFVGIVECFFYVGIVDLFFCIGMVERCFVVRRNCGALDLWSVFFVLELWSVFFALKWCSVVLSSVGIAQSKIGLGKVSDRIRIFRDNSSYRD